MEDLTIIPSYHGIADAQTEYACEGSESPVPSRAAAHPHRHRAAKQERKVAAPPHRPQTNPQSYVSEMTGGRLKTSRLGLDVESNGA